MIHNKLCGWSIIEKNMKLLNILNLIIYTTLRCYSLYLAFMKFSFSSYFFTLFLSGTHWLFFLWILLWSSTYDLNNVSPTLVHLQISVLKNMSLVCLPVLFSEATKSPSIWNFDSRRHLGHDEARFLNFSFLRGVPIWSSVKNPLDIE